MDEINPAWVGLGLFVAIALVFGGYRLFTSGPSRAEHPQYRADRGHPLRRWAHGVLAAYRGLDAGDPGYWPQKDALAEVRDSWSTPDRAELVELLSHYEEHEINVAFDRARIVWLARVGAGASWLSEQESWEYVQRAAEASRRTYPSWDAFGEGIVAGAIEWNRDVGKNPLDEDGVRSRQDRIADTRKRVWSETPFA